MHFSLQPHQIFRIDLERRETAASKRSGGKTHGFMTTSTEERNIQTSRTDETSMENPNRTIPGDAIKTHDIFDPKNRAVTAVHISWDAS